ncbi:MAG: histidinol-phosphate transaminase [Pseudomonadota bacterium]
MTTPSHSPRPNAWLDDIPVYVPGKAITATGAPAIKLSANESAIGPSPLAVEAYRQAALDMHRYPEGSCPELRQKIGTTYDLPPDQIICGAGSDELLNMIAMAFAGPGDDVLYMRHGFMVYPIAARKVGANAIEVPDQNYTADVEALLDHVTDRTKVVFLANPNNPTGTYISSQQVDRLKQGLPDHVVLVIDSAYAEYVDAPDYSDGIDLVARSENVIMTRTFSKIYGLASARLGWAYAPKPIIDALHKVRAPFNVSEPAHAAGIAALSDVDFLEKAKAHNDLWLGWLTDEVKALGLHVVPSVANFILVEFPSEGPVTAETANKALQGAGYTVRWLPGQGLPNCLRISVGLEEENLGVIAALKAFLDQARG